MIVVVDTNVLLVSISSKSKYHWLYRLIIAGKLQIAITGDILSEYEEQLSIHWNSNVALNVTRSLAELPTALPTIIYYNLNLINADKDDNKFVDCAFAANADYIITHDHHFNILKTTDFPTIPIIRLEEFKKLIEKNNVL